MQGQFRKNNNDGVNKSTFSSFEYWRAKRVTPTSCFKTLNGTAGLRIRGVYAQLFDIMLHNMHSRLYDKAVNHSFKEWCKISAFYRESQEVGLISFK
jgi:hypothetical protein